MAERLSASGLVATRVGGIDVVGEIGALCAAGSIELDDALSLIEVGTGALEAIRRLTGSDEKLYALEQTVDQVDFKPLNRIMVSGVTGRAADVEDLRTPWYWRRLVKAAAKGRLRGGTLEADKVVALWPTDTGSLKSVARHDSPATWILQLLAQGWIEGSIVPSSNPIVGSPAHAVPTYPFERQKFWPSTQVTSHPLLESRTTVGGEHRFPLRLADERADYLREHCVEEAPVFPAAAIAEVALASGGFRVELRNLGFDRILPMSADGAELIIREENQLEAEFELITNRGGARQRHAWGTISKSATEVIPRREPRRLLERLTRVVEPEELYRTLDSRRMGYGPRFRSVTETYVAHGDTNELLTRLTLPTDVPHEGYAVHPVYLDGAFQTAAWAAIENSGETEGMFLPVALDGFRVSQPGAKTTWAHVVVAPLGEAMNLFRANIWLLDASGDVTAAVDGLRLQRVTSVNRELAVHLLYERRWTETQLPPSTADVRGQRWVIASDTCPLATELQGLLEELGGTVTSLPLAGASNETSSLLSGALSDQTLAGVIYLSGRAKRPGDMKAYERICRPLVEHVEAMRHGGAKLYLITTGAFRVLSEDTPRPLQAMLAGLGGVVAVEHPNNWSRLIDVEPTLLPDQAARCVVAELGAETADDIVAWRNGARHAARIGELRVDFEQFEHRSDATYVVTGGMGAIGRRFLKWMIDNGARTIAVLGRKQPTGTALADLEELRTGADIRFFAVDVSDRAEMTAVFERLQDRSHQFEG